MLDYTFTAIYVLLFGALVATEIVGIRRKRKGDTITENWRYLDKHLHGFLQWGWRILTIGLLGWIMFHLVGGTK
jgi:hypothetical protein